MKLSALFVPDISLIQEVGQLFIIVTRLRVGLPGFDSRQDRIFLFATMSRPAPGPTQPPIQWVPWLFFRR
jgi:hypothetical protein